MHVESYFQKKEDEENLNQNRPVYSGEKAISLEEIDSNYE